MSRFPEPMSRLIDELKKLPGIGSKSAQRLAFYILRSSDEDAEALATAVRDVKANGKTRPGAFPQSVTALNDFTPELATARPYAVDLTGWFEGYSHPGIIDANGGASRIQTVFGPLSIATGVTAPADAILQLFTGPQGAGQSGGQGGLLTTQQGDRCPGSQERGALYYPEPGFPCNPNEKPTGP